MYNIPVSALQPPPEYLRVRDVKQWYVDYLAGMLLEEGDDHEDLTSPLLVIVSVAKGEFRVKNVAHYSFEVRLQSFLHRKFKYLFVIIIGDWRHSALLCNS